MRIFDIALKDLSQIFRDKLSLVFLIGMPIAFTLFMGFAYKSGTEPTRSRPAPGSGLGEPGSRMAPSRSSFMKPYPTRLSPPGRAEVGRCG